MRSPQTHSIVSVAPIGILGGALIALLIWPIPGTNKDIVMAIVSGLLGFLSRPGPAHIEPRPPEGGDAA